MTNIKRKCRHGLRMKLIDQAFRAPDGCWRRWGYVSKA